jgi:hypothetical protein
VVGVKENFVAVVELLQSLVAEKKIVASAAVDADFHFVSVEVNLEQNVDPSWSLDFHRQSLMNGLDWMSGLCGRMQMEH